LAQKDKNHLERFKSDINAENPVKDIRDGDYPQSSVGITSREICTSLIINYNVIPNKTKILQPPPLVDDNLILAFIAGYIDGDGSISIQSNKSKNKSDTLELSITTGSIDFANWLLERINHYSGSNGTLFSKVDGQYTVKIGSFKILELYLKIKPLNLPLMQRKWGILENIPHERKRGITILGTPKKRGLKKLTEQQIVEIQVLLESKQFKDVQIAKMFNVSATTIGYIKRKNTRAYRWLEGIAKDMSDEPDMEESA